MCEDGRAMQILVGTDDGIRRFDLDGREGAREFAGRTVTAFGAEYPETWAIVDGTEVWRSDGGTWNRRGALDRLRANCIADTRAGYLVGTSEARLYRATDDGLEAVSSFDDVRGRDGWYTPWGGPPDVRSLTEDFDAVFVNVHVGGIVRTLDEGATWEPTIDVDADVHRVLSRDGRVFAACAWGLAVSADRGDRWAFRTDGLHATYCRGVALIGDSVLVSASNGPRGGRSALYRGAAVGDAGAPLERCRSGLPEWFDSNIDSLALDAAPDRGVAAFGTDDGRVFVSQDEGRTWEQAVDGLPAVLCLLVMA
jgi:hypothetical protein